MRFEQATAAVTTAKRIAAKTARSLTYTIACHNGLNPEAVYLTLRSAPGGGAPTQRLRLRTNHYGQAIAWLRTGFPEAYREEDGMENMTVEVLLDRRSRPHPTITLKIMDGATQRKICTERISLDLHEAAELRSDLASMIDAATREDR
jgi:hypothetical protein